MNRAFAGAELLVDDGAYRAPLAQIPTTDPRGALAEALRCYLRAATFLRWGGGAEPPKLFQLLRVDSEWPEPGVELTYPVATVLDAAGTDLIAHNLVPTPLEETWDRFGRGTVLWKTGEAQADLQVDLWANDAPTREAIAARLPQLFAPDESRACAMLKGTPRYYDRPVRAQLISYRRADMEGAVYVRERRLVAVVRCTVDVVYLRCAVEFQPSITTTVLDVEAQELERLAAIAAGR